PSLPSGRARLAVEPMSCALVCMLQKPKPFHNAMLFCCTAPDNTFAKRAKENKHINTKKSIPYSRYNAVIHMVRPYRTDRHRHVRRRRRVPLSQSPHINKPPCKLHSCTT
ncbi:unnamed protein product, partial [Ectocarpus sp. 12 AP-2014]